MVPPAMAPTAPPTMRPVVELSTALPISAPAPAPMSAPVAVRLELPSRLVHPAIATESARTQRPLLVFICLPLVRFLLAPA